jgi:hypothetical protein
VSRERIHATVDADFFQAFVVKYPDKQYQTWLGGHFVKVGTDFNYDQRLSERIAAGIVSHFADFSFASALRILKDNPKTQTTLPRFEHLFDTIESRFHSTSLNFLQGGRPDKTIPDEHRGVIHAELFLLRLLSSLVAARRLINWGFFSEPLTILRSILEELAWAYAVGIKFDRKQLDNPAPSKCIGPFKERFPISGHLYGSLSKFSHMEFEAKKHFVTRGTEGQGSGVMMQSIEFKFFGLLFYSFILIAYQYVCRDLRKFYMQNYDLILPLRNLVLPLRYLVSHALMRPELDNDEIASELSEIYFKMFQCPKR